MKGIKPSRNQNKVYHPELRSYFYNRKVAPDYGVGPKGIQTRKTKIFKEEEEGSVGTTGSPVLLLLFLSGRTLRDVRYFKKDIMLRHFFQVLTESTVLRRVSSCFLFDLPYLP